MSGLPCSGKTLLAKKLSEQGWTHIEVDNIPKSKENQILWEDFSLALIAKQKDFVVYEEMWQPFYDYLF